MECPYDVTCKVQRIDPVVAREILRCHQNYRPLSEHRRFAYANLMIENHWGLSILLFDSEGVLLDGQTRLKAVVDTERPQWFACLHGWPAEETMQSAVLKTPIRSWRSL